MARPSEYDFKLCQEICDRLAEGENIKRILDSDERFPKWNTFRVWKNTKPELNALYVISQQDKAILLENEMDELKDMLIEKEIDNQTYNVLVQTVKWKMAKFYPKVFGDNKQVDLLNNGGTFEERPRLSFEDKTKDE